MSSKAHVTALALLGLSLGLGVLAGACDGNVQLPSTGGNHAGGTGGTGGLGGSGGSGGVPGPSDCDQLCDYLTTIGCQAWQTCKTDCPAKLNAPPDCADEFDTLFNCWLANKEEFACVNLQLLAPAECKEEESAFTTCVNGSGTVDPSCVCSPGVGSQDPGKSCSRITTCNGIEFTAACASPAEGMPWSCFCYADSSLLGTCYEEPDLPDHCDNQVGCCSPYFCAAIGE